MFLLVEKMDAGTLYFVGAVASSQKEDDSTKRLHSYRGN